jgi:23S rRNA pseudouridine1911/1915/1917 synthase
LATYCFKSPQNLHKERFDKVVHTLLNEQVEGGVSKAMARKLVMAGAAYLAGSRCRIASKPVWSGTEVRVEYDANRAKKIDNAVVNLTPDCILYEQAGILVVDKPAGLPTVATLDDARQNLVALLKARLAEQSGEQTPRKPVYLGIHHRLDAETSGCVLFTTDERRNVFVSRLFQEHLVQKEYLAIVTVTAKAPPQAWEVKDQLVRAEKKKNRYASTRKLGIPDAEGSFAYSRFELLEHKGELALIRCIPVTGRTHQLRVHLSEYGLPIVGDRLYGAKRTLESPGRLMLHSYRLAFREEDGCEVAIEAPVPGEFKTLFDLKSL